MRIRALSFYLRPALKGRGEGQRFQAQARPGRGAEQLFVVVLDIGGAAASEIGKHAAAQGPGPICPAAVPQVGIEDHHRAGPAAQGNLIGVIRQAVGEGVLGQCAAAVRPGNDPGAAVFFGVIVYQLGCIVDEIVPGSDSSASAEVMGVY